MAGLRRVRGPLGPALLALPHRDQRLLRHASRAPSAAPARWTSGRRAREAAHLAVLPEVVGPSNPRWARPSGGWRPRGGGRAPRLRPAGVRRRVAAPAAPAARGAHPPRGPAVAGRGGGRAPRHLGRLGQQRALQRARSTLAAVDAGPAPEPLDDADRRLSPDTSTRSSATTSTRSPRCSMRTRPGRCRPTRCGSTRTKTSSNGCSARAPAVVARASWRPQPTALPRSGSTGRAVRAAGTSPGRCTSSSWPTAGSPGSASSSTQVVGHVAPGRSRPTMGS